MGIKFANRADIVGWLMGSGIDTAVWGTGANKSIANLWDEYAAGEISFETNPSMRIVQVVEVLIHQNGATLLELEQVLTNGSRRYRKLPPSEKVKGNEPINRAAVRCLEEELGIGRDQINILAEGIETKKVNKESPSYPGLPTQYIVHTIKAHVSGLPIEDFWRENEATFEGDPVSRHLWGWRERT